MLEPYKTWRINEAIACYYDSTMTAEDAFRNVPKWLEYDANKAQGKVVAMPQRDDIDFEVEEHLIVELYSK